MPPGKGGFLLLGTGKVPFVYARKGLKGRSEMAEEASENQAAVEEVDYKAFDYQSECHCSKTDSSAIIPVGKFDYQSECHCSKTEIR